MKIEMPTPSDVQKQRSLQCMQIILDAVAEQGGMISFERYMQLCLYSKDVGYYESCEDIFGEGGDFTTSPERSKYFALAFALYIQQLKNTLPNLSIVEIGAGSGKFANDLMAHLEQFDCKPKKYVIVEKSAALRQRQQQKLAKHCKENDVVWVNTFDQPLECAVVIANEVLDALPTKLVTVRNNIIQERYVGTDDSHKLKFYDHPATDTLSQLVRARITHDIISQDTHSYLTDINMQLDGFIEQIASFVKQGIFFYIDYGYPRSEYYHEQRSMGTLVCHFKHAMNDDPLLLPGLQDISCSVDFTAVAEAADKVSLNVDCYTTQAHFLLASQVLEHVISDSDAYSLEQQSEVKRLLMPSEMGERFQVMVLNKNVDLSKYQFTTRNLLHRL